MKYGKIKIAGSLEVETGLHIGASSAFSAIGSVDSPVIKHSTKGIPIIPGSSLKGKIRSLLAKAYNEQVVKKHTDDCEKIIRLFGGVSNSKKYEEAKESRLIFRDCELCNSDELLKRGVKAYTEIKFENSIDRFTAEANPRQIERVIPGAKFKFEVIYTIKDGTTQEELIKDIKVLSEGLQLLTYDYLGGHGSRGYGRVSFCDLVAEVVFGEVDSQEILSKINDYFIKVNKPKNNNA